LQSAAVEGNGVKPSEFSDIAWPIMTHAPFLKSHLATISAGNDSARFMSGTPSPEKPIKSDD
jgi:hypothetical protein